MSTELAPILCGTDFSPNANRAAAAAAILATRTGATLLLVHVAEEVYAVADSEERLRAYLQSMEARLEQEAARLRESGARVETLLAPTTGRLPEQVLLQTIEAHTPSLVVISSVSKTAFDRWSLGSVSEHVAMNAAMPTLVIRSATPFEAWARQERPLRLFVAADYGSASATAIQWAGNLRRFGPCEITLAHVERPDRAWERLGSQGELTYTKNPPPVQEALEHNLRERARDLLGDEAVRVCVEPIADRPDARLVEMAQEEEADVIVVGVRRRPRLREWWRPSVASGVLRHAAMSVVCVPAEAIAPEHRPVPELRRVLVATDFSRPGTRAVRYAHALPSPGGQVFLIHVTPPVAVRELVAAEDKAILEATRTRTEALERLRERLRALVPDAAHSPHLPAGVRTEVHVIESHDPVAAIQAAAERFGADVICVGSHGRPGLTAALVGSVARDLMKESHRPVLIVPPPAA